VPRRLPLRVLTPRRPAPSSRRSASPRAAVFGSRGPPGGAGACAPPASRAGARPGTRSPAFAIRLFEPNLWRCIMLSKATAAAAIVGAVAGVAGAAGVTPGASVQRLASPPGIGGKTYPVGVTDDGALWVGSVYTETQLVPVAATDTRGTWAVPISPDWLSGDITDVTGDGAEAVGMPRTSDGNRAAVIPLHGGEPKLLPIEGASSLALGV